MQARSIDQTQCQSYGLCSRLKAPSHVHLLGRIFQLGCGKGQSHRKRAHDARRSGTGSHLTSRVATVGPWRLQVSSSMTTVLPDWSPGLSFLESNPPKRASCVDTRNCRRSFVRLKRSTNPSKFMSSRLCRGSSKMATGNGGFGMPILRARNTDTASAFTWELESTAAGISHFLSSIGSLTMVDSWPYPEYLREK